ncbi:lipoprotein transmembrane [Noviherbaspirillum cavernae]|uniref:Lipoprotein transmembrane n=1 Tax=Noviherbaspirillum cavernae TaxID=2320862 RepID=A0A418WY73_9BURK|nr:chalcone isomerase family protein [Noviherbaspirillum cavernae]RJG05188.1 lipoprotein transmembrane [Noviherbaspirillum cavernae]
MNFHNRVVRTLAILSAATVFGNLAVPASAAEVAGIKLDDTVRVANQDLKLNGAGIRHKLVFKVYVAGLYLPERKTTVPDVLAVSGARRVTIVMMREVGNEEFGRGFMSGIQQNIDRAEKAKFVSQLMKFGEVFAAIPELKKGDVLTVDWIPGTGTLIHLNGRKVTDALPDLAFYNAILRIWLGEKPIDSQLKSFMLGDKPGDAPRSGNS